MKPSIGRIVHYIPYEYEGMRVQDMIHYAALVTYVLTDGEGVNLRVWSWSGDERQEYSIRFDPTGIKPGTWHWPEREE